MCLVFATALTLALPCSAQLASPVHIVPVIAKTGGVAGTDWVTSLSMSNVSDGVIDVTAMFFRENKPNVPPFVPLEIFVLTEGQTMTVEDVLETWFPAQGDTKGTLVLLAYMPRVDQSTSDAEFGPGQSDWKAHIDLCGEQAGLSVHHPGSLFKQGWIDVNQSQRR